MNVDELTELERELIEAIRNLKKNKAQLLKNT